MSEVKHGVKETKDVLALVFALAKVLKAAKENDGVINAADLVLLVNAFPAMGPAFDGIELVVEELKDLDLEESRELLVYAAAHLGEAFDSPELLAKVEKGVAAALALLDFYKELK